MSVIGHIGVPGECMASTATPLAESMYVCNPKYLPLCRLVTSIVHVRKCEESTCLAYSP